MWRRTLGRSPSRARRAAVSSSSGASSVPVSSSVVGIPIRRYIAWSVRTWTSSPEWLDAISASSSPVRSNSRTPPASSSARRPKGLTVERRLTTRSGSPTRWSIRPAVSTSTMSPRCDDSTTPFRICRTRTGGPATRAVRAPPGRPPAPRGGRVPDVGAMARSIARGARIRRDPGWRGPSARRPAQPAIDERGIRGSLAQPPRLAAPGGPSQAGDPARREDRAEEVPRGRPRAVVAAGLRGARRRPDPPAGRPDPDRGHGRRGARRPDRPDPDPARGPRHGRRDAGADADRAGLAPWAVPGRADAAPRRVLQPAPGQRDGRPVPHLRPDARDRPLRLGCYRGPQAVGRGPDQARQPDRGPRGRGGGARRAPGRRDLHRLAR